MLTFELSAPHFQFLPQLDVLLGEIAFLAFVLEGYATSLGSQVDMFFLEEVLELSYFSFVLGGYGSGLPFGVEASCSVNLFYFDILLHILKFFLQFVNFFISLS